MSDYTENQRILNKCMHKIFDKNETDKNHCFICPFCSVTNTKHRFASNSNRMKSHLATHTLAEIINIFGNEGPAFFKLCCRSRKRSLKRERSRINKHIHSCDVNYSDNDNFNDSEFNDSDFDDTDGDSDSNETADFNLAIQYLTMFFIDCDIPESHFNNQYLSLALKTLNHNFPDLTLTSFNKGLDQDLKVVNVCVSNEIEQSKNLYVSFDGTKTLQGQQIQNVSVNTDDNRFFYRLFNFSETSETAVSLGAMQQQVITELNPSKVKGIIADNCNVNIASRAYVHDNSHPLIFQGCAAHEADLILKDILKINHSGDPNLSLYLPAIMKSKIEQCSVYFRKVAVKRLYAEINEEELNQLTVPKLGNDTRWYSLEPAATWLTKYYNNCCTLLNTLEFGNYEMLSVLKRETNDIASYFSTEQFRQSLECIDDILTSGRKFIETLENSDSGLSCVCKLYDTFCNEIYGNAYYETVKDTVFKRNDFFKSKLLQFAYTLDPRHELTHDYIMAGEEYIAETYEDNCDTILDEYDKYTSNQQGYFGISQKLYDHRKTPYDLWKCCSENPLKELSLQILRFPPSIAYNESIWSFFKLINRSRRSRLSVKKIESLLYIRVNLKSIMKESNHSLFDTLIEDKDGTFFDSTVQPPNNDITITNINNFSTYNTGLDGIYDESINNADFLFNDAIIGNF